MGVQLPDEAISHMLDHDNLIGRYDEVIVDEAQDILRILTWTSLICRLRAVLAVDAGGYLVISIDKQFTKGQTVVWQVRKGELPILLSIAWG